jgi:hypothetical protein
METPIATLCDAATDYAGKLNLLGAFDTVLTTKFPAVHPQCAIALRFVFNKGEEGHRVFRLSLVNEDGKIVMPSIELAIEIKVPEEVNYLSRNLIINLQQLKFDAPGQYAVEVLMDQRQIATIPLLVREIKGAGPAEAGL